MITVPSYMMYDGLHCPIEYLLQKYGHDDIFPIAKPIKLSTNTYVFLIPNTITDNFIDLLQEEELCTIDHIKTEEFEYMNFSNKCIGMKSHWTYNDYVCDYFIISEDSIITNDSAMNILNQSS